MSAGVTCYEVNIMVLIPKNGNDNIMTPPSIAMKIVQQVSLAFPRLKYLTQH